MATSSSCSACSSSAAKRGRKVAPPQAAPRSEPDTVGLALTVVGAGFKSLCDTVRQLADNGGGVAGAHGATANCGGGIVAAAAPSADTPSAHTEAYFSSMKEEWMRVLDAGAPLFRTDAKGAWEAWYEALPETHRAELRCSACKLNARRFGGLVWVDALGVKHPLMWTPARACAALREAVSAAHALVLAADITGPFVWEGGPSLVAGPCDASGMAGGYAHHFWVPLPPSGAPAIRCLTGLSVEDTVAERTLVRDYLVWLVEHHEKDSLHPRLAHLRRGLHSASCPGAADLREAARLLTGALRVSRRGPRTEASLWDLACRSPGGMAESMTALAALLLEALPPPSSELFAFVGRRLQLKQARAMVKARKAARAKAATAQASSAQASSASSAQASSAPSAQASSASSAQASSASSAQSSSAVAERAVTPAIETVWAEGPFFMPRELDSEDGDDVVAIAAEKSAVPDGERSSSLGAVVEGSPRKRTSPPRGAVTKYSFSKPPPGASPTKSSGCAGPKAPYLLSLVSAN